MKKFEYDIDLIGKDKILGARDDVMKSRGERGWELVNITHDGLIYAYWKREIKNTVDMGSR
jgi:hypothetical protein